MIVTSQTTRTREVALSSEGSAAPAPAGSLLPSPDASADPLASIYASLVTMQSTSATTDSARSKETQVQREAKIKQQKKETDEQNNGGRSLLGAVTHLLGDVAKDAVTYDYYDLAKDASHDISKDMVDNPTFWSQLKEGSEMVGMVAGAVGTTVATGGAGAPVFIAVGLSAAAMLDSNAHILEKLGVSAKAAGWIDVGLAATSAVVSLGTSLGTSATQIGQTAARAGLALQVVNGATQAANGVATASSAVLEAHNERLGANALQASQNAQRLEQMVGSILDGMKEQEKSSQGALDAVSQAMQTQQATSVALTNFGKG